MMRLRKEAEDIAPFFPSFGSVLVGKRKRSTLLRFQAQLDAIGKGT